MRINFAMAPEVIQKNFDEQSFASFSRLCVDAAKGTLVKYSAAEANKEILHQMRSAMGLSDSPSIIEVKKALNKHANREAMFEILEDVVNETLVTGWQNDPYFQRHVEYKTLALGDSNSFYVPSETELVVSEVAASNHDIHRQRLGAGTEYSVAVRTYGAKIYMEAERFLMGAEDWSVLVEKINRAYTNLINTLINAAILDAGQSLPSPTQWNITIQMNKTNRAKLVKLLSDVSIATGSRAVLMGTGVALSQLTNMVDYDLMAASEKEDVYNMGRIGHFDQYDIVEIPQAFAPGDTSKYLVDETKLFVMPGNDIKFIKMFDEGATQIYEVTDRNVHIDHTFDYEVVRKLGVGVVLASRFGTVTIG